MPAIPAAVKTTAPHAYAGATMPNSDLAELAKVFAAELSERNDLDINALDVLDILADLRLRLESDWTNEAAAVFTALANEARSQ